MAVTGELEALEQRFCEIGPLEFHTSPLYQVLAPVAGRERSLMELVARRRAGQQPTILFFAAVHYLVRREPDSDLARYFASVAGDDALEPSGAGPAFIEFCRDRSAELETLLTTRLVQTNVVKRSVALRLALATIAQAGEWLPVHLVEIGASAGIHLVNDRYRFRLDGRVAGPESTVELASEWRGEGQAPDLEVVPALAHRFGIDLHPLDPTAVDDRDWLRALVWPENGHEAALLDAALAVVASAPPTIFAGDVVDRVVDVDTALPAGEPRVVFHAAVRAHVPKDDRPAFDEAIASLGRRAPLYIVSLEGPTRDDPRPSTDAPFHVLKLRWPDDRVSTLANVEAHGEWIEPIALAGAG